MLGRHALAPVPALLWLLAGTIALCPAPARAGEAEKIERLNKKAMEDYDALEFESARKTLVDCVARLRSAGLDETPLAARTFINLGMVYVAGLHDRSRGEKLFEKALRIDPTLRLDPAVATPELKEAWDEALKSLPGRKRDKAEEARAPEQPQPLLPPEPAQNPTKAEPGAAETLRHTPVEEVAVGQRIAVYAHPLVNIARATLFYRAPGQEHYSQVPMGKSRKVPGDIVGYVPAEASSGKSLQYYIEIYDGAGAVVGHQGAADSPFIVSIGTGAGAAGGAAGGEDKEDPLAEVRRQKALEQLPRPFHEHVYFDLSLGTGGAAIGSGTTTEVAWYFNKSKGQYEEARASSGGFIWSGLALRAEFGAFVYKGLSLGASARFEFFLNNNADSSDTPLKCPPAPDTPTKRCYASTSRGSFGIGVLAKARYTFLQGKMFRPYLHLDAGGGAWRGALNIDGSKSAANPPTDVCSATYDGTPGVDAQGCSGFRNVPGYNHKDRAPGGTINDLNKVCPDGTSCIDSVLLGYALLGGGGGFYVGTPRIGLTFDISLLGAVGGAQGGMLLDAYIGPQVTF